MNLVKLLTLYPQANGQYTAEAPWPNNYHREDAKVPSQQGDVISVTPSGEIQTRQSGTAGAWELFSLDGIVMRFQSDPTAPAYLLTVTGF